LRESYLRGSSGYLVVVDGTRPATLDRALLVNQKAEAVVGELPRILVLNKHDLTDAWETDERRLDMLRNEGWTVVKTSAKTGAGVESLFAELTARMLERDS
jgi:50S ribosomal subunit-associated GTPase HflX